MLLALVCALAATIGATGFSSVVALATGIFAAEGAGKFGDEIDGEAGDEDAAEVSGDAAGDGAAGECAAGDGADGADCCCDVPRSGAKRIPQKPATASVNSNST